jgi:hypothetical protein
MVRAEIALKWALFPGKYCSLRLAARVFKKLKKNPCIGIKKCVIILAKFKGEKEKIKILLNSA